MIRYAVGIALGALQGPARDSLVAEGVRLAPMQPAAALARFEAVLASDSLDLVANWRAAVAGSDAALPLTARSGRPARDSLLATAQQRARRAVRLAPDDAQTLFVLGLVLGNTALTRGVRDRVKLAEEIRSLALRAIAADSLHDGAHHLMGRWNYEVMRLSGLERFVARNLLGAGTFGEASWEEARREMARAVALDPVRIYHHLDFARVLLARKDPAAAAELRRAAELPIRFAADTTYRREALELLEKLRRR